MVFKNFRVTKTRVFIIGLLFILSLITLWIRVIPLLNLNTDILNIVASDDPMFSLRQIEQMMAHYPSYAWFDAMTLYPFGKDIPWGPLFTLIATTFVMIFGASTRSEIISVALWVPPLMAAVTVPVMYLLGKKLADWKTGLCAAILITAVGGQYFYRSLAGYLDHHIAEVLFSTLFCFTYIFALVYLRDHPVDFNVKSTWKTPIVLSTVAGVAYILGYLTMSTMILFAFITALFTLIIFILDFYHGNPSQYIVLLNTLVFGIAAVFSLLVSFISGGIDAGLGFYLYTLIHPIAYLLLVIGTWLLFWLGHYLEGKNRVMYPLSIIGIGFIAILSVFLFLPALYGSFVNGIEVFFGFNPFAATVQEARVWSIEEAWEVFNFGLILMIGGVLVLIYRDWKQYHGEHVYVLVWTLFIVIAAFRQVRYEYYLAVNIALLGAICIGFFINLAEPEIRLLSSLFKSQGQSKLFKDEKRNLKKSLKPEKKPSSDKKPNYIKIMSFGLICACAVLYIGGSVQYELRVAGSGALRMNPDWRESLEWMEKNTPDPGVDYYRIYQKETFRYPPESYGVMSWWDYGHLITYIAKRIPNANPFQSGVAGENGAAAFFMTADEERNSEIAKALGVRYVMTDVEMDIGKFWAMATWFNTSAGLSPYTEVILVPGQGGTETYSPVEMYEAPYFVTMISRLHNFDGSMADAKQVYYVEVDESRTTYPVATKALAMDPQAALEAADAYNRDAAPGKRALVISPDIRIPVGKVPALRHYRLVHESPTNILAKAQANASPDLITDMRYVKVFEYVPGARIAGEGTIEVDVVTNTGREFTYRQESRDGTFIVPYATTGSPYEVRTKGKYRIVGTGREFEVPEEAVLQGLPVG